MDTAVLFGKSKWIWAADAVKKNSNIILRRLVSFGQNKPPQRALCRAACNTHYYLYINGNAVVWEGGLNRSNERGYYDEFDIAPFLSKGDNVIVVFCQYFGNEGTDLVCAKRAGFIFECNDLEVYSDSSFTVYENPAYKMPRLTNCRYAGYGVLYDAALEGPIQNVYDPSFNISQFVPATEHDVYPDDENGVLTSRPFPLPKFSAQPVSGKIKRVTDQFNGDTYIVSLPRYMRVTPYMEVAGNGQEKITITTDRTQCMGGFADEMSTYVSHSVEYITKPTLNIYDGMLPMTGNTLIFSMPRSVKVMKLGYREIRYAPDPTCIYQSDEFSETIFQKGLNTLFACMGSTLMDTPERERTMWLGDAGIMARAAYLASSGGAAFVKKTIDDILEYARGGTLYSCVPGNLAVDIPAQGLVALSEYGIFGAYYNYVGDLDLFRANFEAMCNYLLDWGMTENGVEPREGTLRFYDNLYNTDMQLLENALYYNACKFMREVGERIGYHDFDENFEDIMGNIADYIESTWDGHGYNSDGGNYDDRANAFIVLSGLVPDERKAAMSRLLSAVVNASPYMEWAVLQALCELGRRDLARARFESRYALAAKSDSTTLGEDFNGYGTSCQGYQSATVFEAIELFGGIKVMRGASAITITPDFTAQKDFRAKIELVSGRLEVRYKYSPVKSDIIVENGTSAKVELVIVPELVGRTGERRTIIINKGKNKFAI